MDGEALNCYREVGNTHDPCAVAVRKDAVTVGHVPRAISSVQYSYVEEELFCVGTRRYSADLLNDGIF